MAALTRTAIQSVIALGLFLAAAAAESEPARDADPLAAHFDPIAPDMAGVRDVDALRRMLEEGPTPRRNSAALQLGAVGGDAAARVLIDRFRTLHPEPYPFDWHDAHLIRGLGMAGSPAARAYLLERSVLYEKTPPPVLRAGPRIPGNDPGIDPLPVFIDALGRYLSPEDNAVADRFDSFWKRAQEARLQAAACRAFAIRLRWEATAVHGNDLRRMLAGWMRREETRAFQVPPPPPESPAQAADAEKLRLMEKHLADNVPAETFCPIAGELIRAHAKEGAGEVPGLWWLSQVYLSMTHLRAFQGGTLTPEDTATVGLVIDWWKRTPADSERSDRFSPRGRLSRALYLLRDRLPEAMRRDIESGIPENVLRLYDHMQSAREGETR